MENRLFSFLSDLEKNYSKFWSQKRLKQLLFSNQCNTNVLFQYGCMFPCVIDFNNALIVGKYHFCVFLRPA